MKSMPSKSNSKSTKASTQRKVLEKAESMSTSSTHGLMGAAPSPSGIILKLTRFPGMKRMLQHRHILSLLILVVGVVVCTAFLVFGIQNEQRFSQQYFEQSASDLANSIQAAWHDYEIYSLWAHESCHKLQPSAEVFSTRLCSHAEFRNLYEHILSLGLGLKSLQYVMRVEDSERADLEQESREYLAEEYPYINYTGIMARNGSQLYPQTQKPFYFPVVRQEPIEGNEEAIDLDVYESAAGMIDAVLDSWGPLLSPGGKSLQDPDVYSVYLVHPGVNTSVSVQSRPQSVTSTVIRIPDLLARAAKNSINGKRVYLFDSTDKNEEPRFLGGANIWVLRAKNVAPKVEFESLPEISYATSLKQASGDKNQHYEKFFDVVNRQWLVTIVPLDDSHEGSYIFVVIGGVIILAAFLLLTMINHMKLSAEREKEEMAQSQIERERQLNEYLAHEVRNPLSSAISAVSFVSATTQESVDSEETKKLLLDDLNIAESSLTYINELLRSMLDINRCTRRQIRIDNCPTDILQDVLRPTAAILCTRGAPVDIQVDCRKDLLVSTDRLRLKQIIVNLAVNATKFVLKGFVRLRADVVDGSVRIFVEDSGPGLPPATRDTLFRAFQESFDLLSQGTGIGLYLCRHLSDLMGASIALDESYRSEVEGCPGARFVLDLRKPPLDSVLDARTDLREPLETDLERGPGLESEPNATDVFSIEQNPAPTSPSKEVELPENLSVLFVDDDLILRKLFIRTVRRVAPTWTVHEAGNGEAALLVVKNNKFDIIFMDQYMPGIERPLLGTETVRLLRISGAECTICGLSANDIEDEYHEAGADAFMIKPFPCEKNALCTELKRVVEAGRARGAL